MIRGAKFIINPDGHTEVDSFDWIPDLFYTIEEYDTAIADAVRQVKEAEINPANVDIALDKLLRNAPRFHEKEIQEDIIFIRDFVEEEIWYKLGYRDN